MKNNVRWISTKEALPKDGEEVVVFVDGKEFPATIRHGITEEQRERMRNGELSDPIEFHWSLTEGYVPCKRSRSYQIGDVHGNNAVPYEWDGPGPYQWFGQDIKWWRYPSPPPDDEPNISEVCSEEDDTPVLALSQTDCNSFAEEASEASQEHFDNLLAAVAEIFHKSLRGYNGHDE